MSIDASDQLGLLCPDGTWIPWQELGNLQLFGNNRMAVSDSAVSEVHFTLSAASNERHLQLCVMGNNRES
jgi:hypothetical protein